MMPQFSQNFIVLLACLPGVVGCQKISVFLTSTMQSSSSGTTAPGAQETPTNVEPTVQRNAELLQELYRVVLAINPKNPSEFGNWLNSLNQGASLEGVYNGFTRSDLQRAREADTKTTANPKAIGVFVRELVDLLMEFREIPELTFEDAKPLSSISTAAEEVSEAPSSLVITKPQAPDSFQPFASPSASSTSSQPSREQLEAKMTRIFSGASVFTLKRVLGEWGLKVLAFHREESRERMRDWYADFAAKQARKGVDFGLDLRREPNREFHRNWAEQVSDDLIRWEVLNRLHRVLNAAQVQGG
ncbi:MAG: hypothetical protein KGQ59_00540 [Bdellovibrionales bacterium]|nr:hypothetical protein [Bdellovibrionales bacterium]